MKRFFTWLYYLSKRQLLNIFFVIILLSMPLCALMLKHFATAVDASITIGILDENKTELSETFIESLNTNDDIINYIEYYNRADLEADIISKDIQCGYIIVNNFDSQLKKASVSKLIELVSTPENSIALLSNEILFSKLFKQLGYYTLLDEIDNVNVFEGLTDSDYNAIRKEYDSFMESDRVFNFRYSTINGTYVASDNLNVLSYITTPIRGLVALLIFLGALTGGFTYLKDKKNGLGVSIQIYDIIIPVFFTSISGIFSLYIAQINKSLLVETLSIFLYDIIVILFVLTLLKIINNSTIFCSTIPVFSIGSLVCCPIFINLATFFPIVKVIQLLFMPTYYYFLFNYFVGILT